MIFEWLEDMVDEGLISEKTAEAIYKDCDSLIKEGSVAGEVTERAAKRAKDLEELGKMTTNLINLAVGGGAGMLGFSAVGGLLNKLKANSVAQELVKNRELIGMAFAPNKEKAEARYTELATVAPSVAADLSLSEKILKGKVNSGFSSQDYQGLAMIQSTYSADNPALKPAAADAMSMSMSKSAGLQDMIADEKLGEIVFDCYKMTSESGIFKEAAGMFPNKGDFLKYVGALTFATSIPALLSTATGAVKHFHGKKMQAQMEKDLETSFDLAIKKSRPEDPIRSENREKVKDAFKALAHFAPNVALQPEAARSFMNRMVSYDQGLMTSDLKDLTQIESNIRSGVGPSDFAQGFGAASKALGVAPIAQEAVKQTMRDIATAEAASSVAVM